MSGDLPPLSVVDWSSDDLEAATHGGLGATRQNSRDAHAVVFLETRGGWGVYLAIMAAGNADGERCDGGGAVGTLAAVLCLGAGDAVHVGSLPGAGNGDPRVEYRGVLKYSEYLVLTAPDERRGLP